MKHDTYFDIGAANGYHTYGFAWAAKRAGHKSPTVVAVEPEATQELLEPMTWLEYSDCQISVVEKFCGPEDNEREISLGNLLCDHNGGLVKIDIEGGEKEIFQTSPDVVKDTRFDWCIEIHGNDLIPNIAQAFCSAKRNFLIQEIKPLPILGRECRSIETVWLTSI